MRTAWTLPASCGGCGDSVVAPVRGIAQEQDRADTREVQGCGKESAPDCGHMRIDLSATPHRVDDLLRFLRLTGYIAHEVDYAIVEIDVDTLPPSALGVAPMALALRLRVWNEVNDAEARLVEANLLCEP
jgi:hypothetical protein